MDADTRPIFTAEYFVRDNLGIELLAATPFSHEVTLGGSIDAGTVKHLPPTLSLNYHFPTNSVWKPYVGAGINYTIFLTRNRLWAIWNWTTRSASPCRPVWTIWSPKKVPCV